jgi:hypothetical protein
MVNQIPSLKTLIQVKVTVKQFRKSITYLDKKLITKYIYIY